MCHGVIRKLLIFISELNHISCLPHQIAVKCSDCSALWLQLVTFWTVIMDATAIIIIIIINSFCSLHLLKSDKLVCSCCLRIHFILRTYFYLCGTLIFVPVYTSNMRGLSIRTGFYRWLHEKPPANEL